MSAVASTSNFSLYPAPGYSYRYSGIYGPGYYYNPVSSGLPPVVVFAIIVAIIAFFIGLYSLFEKDSCKVWFNNEKSTLWCKEKTILSIMIICTIIGLIFHILAYKMSDDETDKKKKDTYTILGHVFLVPFYIIVIIIVGAVISTVIR
jgi:hypothetical protein